MTNPPFFVEIHNETYKTGYRNGDGYRETGYRYRAMATDAEGNRWLHDKVFDSGCTIPGFERALRQADNLTVKIVKAMHRGQWAGPVGNPHWTPTDPQIGSPAHRAQARAFLAALDSFDDVTSDFLEGLDANGE